MQNKGKDLESSNRIDETLETRQITEQPESKWTTLIYNINTQYEKIPKMKVFPKNT